MDDPARVKELIGSVAQLKIVEVKNEGPWKTKEEGLASEGRHLPLNTELLDYRRRCRQRVGWLAFVNRMITWIYLISGSRNAPWHRFRILRTMLRQFTLSQDGGRKFGPHQPMTVTVSPSCWITK